MYSLHGYGKMLAEPVRRQAYFDAIESSIEPGCVVLELGTGPGIFALHAARCGARKVYAVEPSDSIQVARELAAANGLSDRIEFFQCPSTETELPERADLVVSDLRGVLPLFPGHLSSIVDARQRLMAPGGQLIPREDSLWCALVSAEKDFQEITSGWDDDQLGFDLSTPRGMATNAFAKARIQAAQCLVEPQRWAVLRYHQLDSYEVEGRLRWQRSRKGTAHGLAVWFDTQLTPEVGFSNAPGEPELIYGQMFFPFPSPVPLDGHEQISVELRAVPTRGDFEWSWKASIKGPNRDRHEIRQSSFLAGPLSPFKLRARSASFAPRLTKSGERALFVLSRIDGDKSAGEIAGELQAAFPRSFEDTPTALASVADLIESHALDPDTFR